jgi:hypothetical protein
MGSLFDRLHGCFRFIKASNLNYLEKLTRLFFRQYSLLLKYQIDTSSSYLSSEARGFATKEGNQVSSIVYNKKGVMGFSFGALK